VSLSTQWWPWTKLQPAVRPRSTVSQSRYGRPCHRWRCEGPHFPARKGPCAAAGGRPGGGGGRFRPQRGLEGVPAGRARNKGWLLCKATKEASVGKWSRSCSQPLRRPSCATCEMSDAGRTPPPSCGHQLLQSYGHRPAARLLAAAAQRRFAAMCRNTGDLQPSQQRARKQVVG